MYLIIYSRCLFLMQSTFQKVSYKSIHNIKYIVRISNPHSHNKLTSSHRNVSKAPLVAMSHHWHTHTSALHDVSGQTERESASPPPPPPTTTSLPYRAGEGVNIPSHRVPEQLQLDSWITDSSLIATAMNWTAVTNIL